MYCNYQTESETSNYPSLVFIIISDNSVHMNWHWKEKWFMGIHWLRCKMSKSIAGDAPIHIRSCQTFSRQSLILEGAIAKMEKWSGSNLALFWVISVILNSL